MSQIISKQQLAEAYGLNVQAFFRKVNSNECLKRRLKRVGYTETARTLTPRQILIICEFYGSPNINLDKD